MKEFYGVRLTSTFSDGRSVSHVSGGLFHTRANAVTYGETICAPAGLGGEVLRKVGEIRSSFRVLTFKVLDEEEGVSNDCA